MVYHRGWFVIPNTPANGQLFINSATLYASDAAYVMDDDNLATVLQNSVTISSLKVAQINTKKVPLEHMVLAKKWGILLKKSLNMIHCTTQHGVHKKLYPSLSRQFRTNDHQLQYRRLQCNVYSDILLVNTVSKRGNKCAQIFATDFGGHTHSQ